MMILSVIIPVYNAEKWLRRCLDSLLSQGLTEDEMEVICVNDGSTDGSLEVLHEYERRYYCVKVLSKDNGGSASARNAGLDVAKGYVITFCDADDYVIPNAYSYLLKEHWNDEVDVLKYDAMILDRYVQKEWKESNNVEGSVVFCGSGIDFYAQSMQYFVWHYLYRRSFIEEHNLRFRPLTLCDDSAFCLDVFMQDPRTKHVTSNVYRYTIAEGQLTRKRDECTMRRIVDSYLILLSNLKDYASLNPMISERLCEYQCQQMTPCMSRMLSASMNRDEFVNVKKRLKALNIYPLRGSGLVRACINFVLFDYTVYVVACILYRHFFLPCITPYLRRN